mgnify:CR=1 FL=1
MYRCNRRTVVLIDIVPRGSILGTFRWKLTELALGRSFGRVARTIDQRVRFLEFDNRWALYLKALSLVEMSQRSLPTRIVERSLAPAFKVVHPDKTLTLGPLQLGGAPFSFGRTVDQAIDFLIARDYTPAADLESIRALAGHWHGATQADSGAGISYPDALLVSISVLASDLVDPSHTNAKLISGLAIYAEVSSQLSVGDDMPWRCGGPIGLAADSSGKQASPLGMYRRECTDFALWRLNSSVGFTSAPWKFHNSALLLGDARMWLNAWRRNGWRTGKFPVVGCVVYFPPNVAGAGVLGHVAIVASVNAVAVTIEEYNFRPSPYDHRYGIRTISSSPSIIYLYHPDS